jgi:hypothetical protein
VSYILNASSPSDVANWARQQNIPKVPTGLGFLAGRPNRAIEYGNYNVLPLYPVTHISGMGQDATVNMKWLLGGVALLAAGLFLLGGKQADRTRGRRRERLRRRLQALEA